MLEAKEEFQQFSNKQAILTHLQARWNRITDSHYSQVVEIIQNYPEDQNIIAKDVEMRNWLLSLFAYALVNNMYDALDQEDPQLTQVFLGYWGSPTATYGSVNLGINGNKTQKQEVYSSWEICKTQPGLLNTYRDLKGWKLRQQNLYRRR